MFRTDSGSGLIFEMMLRFGRGTPDTYAEDLGIHPGTFSKLRHNRLALPDAILDDIARGFGRHVSSISLIPLMTDDRLTAAKARPRDAATAMLLSLASRYGDLDALDGSNSIVHAYSRSLFEGQRFTPSVRSRTPRRLPGLLDGA